jgi:hypothetical protein
MTILTFALGILLFVAGAGSLANSLSLLPTELGMLYAISGVVLIAASVVTLAVGVAVRRLDTLTRLIRAGQFGEHASEFVSALTGAPHELDGEPEALEIEPTSEAPAVEVAHDEVAAAPVEHERAPAQGPAAIAADEAAEALSNEVNADRAPTSAEMERALADPDGPATLVGHYSAGGANYKIFSDGSIEAETETGAFRFDSMDDFKAFLAGEQA